MADNIAVTPGTGATVAADDIGGVLFQRIKPTFGADGVATDVSSANPLPVVQTGALAAGTANIGDVDVLTVGGQTPAFGAGVASSATLRVAVASDQLDRGEYEWCTVSVTTVLGATGAIGDFLNHVLIVPGTTSPGAVQIRDGTAGTPRTIFTGGASSVSNLASIDVNIGAVATAAGGWAIITGANVTAIGFGNFT